MNESFFIVGCIACTLGSVLHFQFHGNYPIAEIDEHEKNLIDRRRLIANSMIVLLGLFLVIAAFLTANILKVSCLSISLLLMVGVCVVSMREAFEIIKLRKKYQKNERLNELKEEIQTILSINDAAKETKSSSDQ